MMFYYTHLDHREDVNGYTEHKSFGYVVFVHFVIPVPLTRLQKANKYIVCISWLYVDKLCFFFK